SLDAFGVHGVGGFLGAVLTGVFAVEKLWQVGSGTTDPLGKLAGGHLAQVQVQLLAALGAAGYSFGVTPGVVKGVGMTGGFCLPPKLEELGADRGIHGEVGFDLDPVEEAGAETMYHEPKPASVPPDGHRRFTVVVEGAKNGDLLHTWSAMCQAGAAPASSE